MSNSATDFLKQPLEEGAVVILTMPRYAELTVGVALRLTPQKVHVAYMHHRINKILVDHRTVCVTDNAVAIKRAEKIKAEAIKEGWLPDPNE